ncbi:pentapeptide repeat-containing protein [Apibacter raozihei]|uniref:pentapeptide repeat-containing protein n=1 Tax=Apibacter raozihei TaxID=2500547 RepID=UPI000FE3C085|nr:pentapeptide repeat-containing protein [Apibacter raozihei]
MRILDNENLKKIIDDLRIKSGKSNFLIPIDLESSIIKDLIVERGGYIYANDSNVYFENSIFNESDLINTPFACYNWKFDNCIFIKCNLSKLFISESEIKGCKFIECNLFEMNLEGALIEDSIFLSCDFSAADFDEATIKKTKFINNYNLSKEYGFKNIIEDCNVWDNKIIPL